MATGFALVKYPFTRMEEFRRLEREATEKGLGCEQNASERGGPGWE